MAILSDYTAGSITVAANGTTVTGTGTGWQVAEFREGDWLIADGWVNVIASVDSNTQLTLVAPWRGVSLSDAPYRLRYMSDGSRASAQARQLIDMLGGSGNLEAFGALASAANTMPYFTGAGTAATTPLTPFARTLLDDANAAAFWGTIGTTSPPQSAFRRGNILGTVSQTGGIPTGAIIERGSNANGEYVRFADGTQICTRSFSYSDRTTPRGPLWSAENLSWSYPANFTATPVLSGHTMSGSAAAYGWLSLDNQASSSVSAANFTVMGTTSQSGPGSVMLQAIGRWF